MACVDNWDVQYHRVSSSKPVHPHRPCEPKELDTSATTPLPPSTPPQPKRGILRTSSTDSGSISSPKKSHFNTVEVDTRRDSEDSVQKQVLFSAEVQTVCQTTNTGDVRMDNSTDNGGTDEDGESELNIPAAADDDHHEAATTLNNGDGGDTKMEEAFLLEERAGKSRPSCRRVPSPMVKLRKLKSHLDFDQLARNELELKANMYFHIGNPIKRWRVEKVVPIKLLLQLLKTFCVITQVILFTLTIGHKRAQFFYESREVFENLFVEGFNSEKPRSTYTAYTIQDVLGEIDYIATRYYQLPDITIGGYDFVRDENGSIAPIRLHLRQYTEAILNATSFSYVLNGSIHEAWLDIHSPANASAQFQNWSKDPLFHRFIDLEVSIPVNSIRIVHPVLAECFLFTIQIVFKNDKDSGKVFYVLKENYEKKDCNGTSDTSLDTLPMLTGFLTFLDVIVIGLCCISLLLTFGSLRRALKLARAMGSFYRNELKLPLSWWDRRPLFSLWHLFNVISDLVIIAGTLLKILLNFNVIIDANGTRVLLGTALVLQAGVILRYISYFNELNALTRTLVLAAPELLKFLLCGGILFIAFALCGWIVLGPYHSKFRDLNSASEGLFGLLNGDDIYNTYTMISLEDDAVAYIYSRIFLYLFLALFIYAVLNLFTSLVISAYEASQKMDTATQNEVRRFVFSGPLTPNGVALRDVTITRKYVDPELIKNRAERLKQKQDRDCSL